MTEILDFILHIQDHLYTFTAQYGLLVYALLFLIVFCETGLVVTPFLPGDSLLFAVGAIAADASSGINIWLASALLLCAAILGDTANYWIGRKFSYWAIQKFPRIIKQSHLDKTNEFFQRYGGKTIIIARFVPIVRTFAPFVAGSGAMNYKRFMYFNVSGAILWLGLLLPAGYLLGNAEFTVFGHHFSVKENFGVVVIAIIVISVMPMVYEICAAWLRKKQCPIRPANTSCDSE